MDERDDLQSSTQKRRNRKTSTPHQQNGEQPLAAQRPTNDDKEAWKEYWTKQGFPWRTEPEIDAERQKHLTERRAIVPDIERDIYPFKDIKLSRADVEWLLATHEAGLGAAMQMIAAHARGLDLRGADLRGVNLSRLPLIQALPQETIQFKILKLGHYLFSLFFDLLAGYGYKPSRSIISYLLIVGLFTLAYFTLGLTSSGLHHLQWYEALVVSLTAFHGRGFFSGQFQPGDPQAIIAAVEAVIGLLIEISFIATFTQRFFGR